MTPAVEFVWSSKDLRIWTDRNIERATVRALSMAGGDALRQMRIKSTAMVRAARKMKLSPVKKALPVYFPVSKGIDGMVWRMRASGAAIPLTAFPLREIKGKTVGRKGSKQYVTGGVSVQLKTGGARTFIVSAFKAKMDSGHVGIFRRRTAKPLPIDQAFGPTVADVMGNRGVIPEALSVASIVFSRSFERLLPLELAKLAPR